MAVSLVVIAFRIPDLGLEVRVAEGRWRLRKAMTNISHPSMVARELNAPSHVSGIQRDSHVSTVVVSEHVRVETDLRLGEVG